MLITFAFAFDSHLYTGTSQGLTFLHAPGYCTFANTDVFGDLIRKTHGKGIPMVKWPMEKGPQACMQLKYIIEWLYL